MGRGRPYKCPYCEGSNTVAKGFRYNKSGTVRLRRCKGCGKRWTAGPASSNGAAAGSGEDPTPSEQNSDNASEAQQPEEVVPEADGSIELSLPAEESPSQNDPGEGRRVESEETFFTQGEMRVSDQDHMIQD